MRIVLRPIHMWNQLWNSAPHGHLLSAGFVFLMSNNNLLYFDVKVVIIRIIREFESSVIVRYKLTQLDITSYSYQV